jgi:WD40 repeat protein
MSKRLIFLFLIFSVVLVSAVQAEEVDLIASAAAAKWQNGDMQVLRFGLDGQASGAAKYLQGVTLEDGKTYEKVLFTHPQWKKNGSVLGFFYNIRIPDEGGKFIVAGGFLQEAKGTDGVNFSVQFVLNEAVLTRGSRVPARGRVYLGSFYAKIDGKIDKFEFDLERAAGQTGIIVLKVEAGNSPDRDWAVWTEAKIVWGKTKKAEEQKIEKKAVLLKTLTGHTNRIYQADFSNNGKFVVTASGDNSAKVWNVKTGQMVLNLGNHYSHVFCASFSPDSRFLVTVDGDVANVWNIPSGRLHKTLKGHTKRVHSARFNSSGTRIVTTSEDGSIKMWDIASARVFRNIQITNKGWTYTAVFNPRGGSIAVGAQEGLLEVWDVNNGKRIMQLRGHSRAINTVRFNKNCSRLLSASVDNSVKLWEIPSGRLIRTFSGRSFNSADFSPDGKFILTANDGGKAVVWRAKNGQKVMQLNHAPGGRVLTARFSRDGKFVVTAGENKVVKIWKIILPQ